MDLTDSQRIGFALKNMENAAVAAEWSLEEPIGLLLPNVDAQFSVGSSYDAFVATCEVIRNHGLCHLVRSPVIKQVHLMLAALKAAKVAAATSGADASARLRGALLEVAKRRLDASFAGEAALDAEWPRGLHGQADEGDGERGICL